ncbi:IS3 family transposase [Salinibacter ruber]|uniref:IS3 family transposase n=1 Tax=Salinibacter ruber TaxID=146919 RepID=UPI003555F0CA
MSRSGYYVWRCRPPSKRARENAMLTEEIAQIHARTRGAYGARRIHIELQAGGTQVGKKRVARLMKALVYAA